MGNTKQRLHLVVLLGFMFLAAGCGGSETPFISPAEIIARSASRMAAHTGFEFLVERTGEPAFLDLEGTISFRRAEGQFVSPDRAHTKVRVITPGLVAEMQIVSIGDSQWETNLLTGQWQPSDPIYSFNPSLLFNPEKGIPSVLARELTAPTMLGLEELPEIPGKQLYVLGAALQGATANQMTFGMIDNENLSLKLWIDPDTFDLYRVILIDPADAGDQEDTAWQIDFWNFDGAFDIKPP
jgi:hypothetical protein